MPTIKYKDGSTWKTLDLFSGGTGVVYITGEPGAKVSWSNDSKDDTGNVTLNAAGTATVMTSKNEVYTFVDETNGLVLEKEITSYNKVDLSGITHTLEIPLGSYANTVKYTGETASKSPGWANWKDDPLFQNVKVCLLNQDGTVNYYLDRDNYTKSADGKVATPDLTGKDGNVMVEFPIMGWKIEKSGGTLSVAITTKRNQPGFCYRAHSLENEGDCSKIYIGAYLASSTYVNNKMVMTSVSGAYPASINITNTLTYIKNMNNVGYQPYQYYTHVLMQILYLFIFRNTNCQTSIGNGFCYGTPAPNVNSDDYISGKTNSVAFCGSRNVGSYNYVKCLGLENLWGITTVPLLGAAYGPDNGFKADYKNLEDPTKYRYSCVLGATTGINFISNVYGTNDFPFAPTAISGSESTGFCDMARMVTGATNWTQNIPYTGGDYNTRVNGSVFDYGIFYQEYNTWNASAGWNGTLGERLIFKKLGSWAS